MASRVLGKKKKVALPAGWVEQFTKKHPDRPYYFNEETGETRWTPPVDDVDKATEKPKGKKRKIMDDEDEPQVAPAVEPKNNDTPAMRLYREKVAQRRAAQEAKRGTPKSKVNVNRTVTPQKENANASSLSTPSIQTRLRRSSVVPPKDNDSASSDGSVVSSVSMGSKIKSFSKEMAKVSGSMPKTPRTRSREIPSCPPSIHKLPKIPKVQPAKAEIPATSESVSPDKSNLRTPSGIKNQANERLQKLRKSLSAEKNKQAPTKRVRRTVSIDLNDNDSEMVDQKITENNHVKVDEEEIPVEDRVRIAENSEAVDAFCEQMDWEPIEDEKITFEVYSVRNQLCEKPAETLSELSSHVMNSGHVPKESNALYVVIDTNVFLSNLPFVEEVRDSQSDNYGRPFIVVPWTVLQELDYIKDDRSNSRSQALKLNARKAVDFLNRHFAAKHPRFLGQTPTEVERNKQTFEIECPDDEILQTCLQVKSSTRTAVLLSYDKNLCTKAMLHDIITLGRDEPLEKIAFLKAAETTDFLSNSLHAHIEETAEDVSIIQKEMLEADDIMEEAKAIIKSVLSNIVAKEMEGLFGNRWEMHVIIRPPWSVVTVLKCVLKHWMAAVSESFTERRIEPVLRQLLEQINNVPEGGRKLQDVRQFIDKCNDVVQTLKLDKHRELKTQALEKIEALNQRCTDVIDEVNGERFNLSVGTEPDPAEAEKRAFTAFKVLEELYDFARDVCGTASEKLGLQSSIQYNKSNSHITPEIAIEQEKDVGINVDKLAQALVSSLTGMSEGTQPNDRIVRALYKVIVNFSSDLKVNELAQLTPLDLFCCLKYRRQQIEKGIDQLQELSVHFARLANKRCSS